MKIKYLAITALAAAAALAGCSVPGGWSVDGIVEEAPEGMKLALENYSNGRWLLVDSLTVDSRGAFGYDSRTPARFPEIMRLTLPGKGSVFFPVDSVDDITIETSMANFGAARIAGSPAAREFAAVDSIIAAHEGIVDVGLRHELAGRLTADTTGIVAYYIVSKSVGNTPIFDPNDSFGNRIYGAAAQQFAQYHPDDPRGEALTRAYFNGRVALGRYVPSDSVSAIEVSETGLLDIELYDYNGTMHKLSEVAGKGKVVLLSFTAYDTEGSPAYNAALNEIYTARRGQGLEIYQVAFDANEADWKNAARNLPWITVWNSPSEGDALLRMYNVGVIPMTYVIDAQGTIRDCVIDPAELPSAVNRCY